MAEPLVDMTASSLDSNRPDAFVTLLTSTSYLPGTLTLLHALNELHPSPRDFKIVCLVTPETVDARTIGSLRNAGYDLVIGVEPIASGPSGRSGLQLMGRSLLRVCGADTKTALISIWPSQSSISSDWVTCSRRSSSWMLIHYRSALCRIFLNQLRPIYSRRVPTSAGQIASTLE